MTSQPPSEPSAYASFDHRTRKVNLGPVRYFASDPCTGAGTRLPRIHTLSVGPWRLSFRRQEKR